MAGLIGMPRAAWKRQPSGPVRIDYQNPLAAGLRVFVTHCAGKMVEWVKMHTVSTDTSIPTVSPLGVSRDYTNQQTIINSDDSYNILGPITIATYARVDALTNYGQIITSGLGTTTNLPFEFRVGRTATDGKIGFIRSNAGYRIWAYPADIISAGDRTFFGVRQPSGGIEITPEAFVRSTYYTMSSVSGTGTGTPTAGNGNLYIGKRSDGLTYLDGAILYVAAWARALRNEELSLFQENPWQLFSPRVPLFYSIPSGGATTHDSALTFAYIASIYPSVNARFNAGLTLSTLAGAMSGPSAQFNSALTLDTNVSITLQRALTALATVQMDMTVGQSVSALNAAVAAITESISCSYTSSVTANLLAGLSLAISQGLLSSTSATLNKALTLALNATLTPSSTAGYATQFSLLTTLQTALNAALSTSATLTLPAIFTVTIDGERFGINDLVLALNVQTGISTTATAILSAQLTLATQLLATPAGVGSFRTALTLANQLNALFTTGNAITSSLSLAVSLALADAAAISLGGSLELGAVLSQVQSALAAFQADLTLPTTLAAPITGGLAMDDEISLVWTLRTNLDGAFFEIIVTLSTGRLVVIQSSERLISIQANERLIFIQP